MLLFNVGIIILLYLIAKNIKIKKENRIWFLLLLLLIPGFWIYSIRLMLDVPAAFSVLLIIYLLIKKGSAYKISAALLLLLLVKEYYIFLIFPFTLFILLLDIFNNKQKRIKKVGEVIKVFLILSLPCTIVVMFLIDFNYLPYPRLLENIIYYLFGDLFHVINKIFINILNLFINILNLFITANSSSQVITSELSDVVNKVKEVKFIGDIPSGIKSVPDLNKGDTFIGNIWGAYKANYGDNNMNLLLLSLMVTGVIHKIMDFFRNTKKRYEKVRIDIIFLCLLLLFVFFSLYEMKHVSTFRVVLPIIFAFIYFAFIGLQKIFESHKKSIKIFIGSTIFFLFLYWLSFYNMEYSSLLSKQGLFNILFEYKHYFFIFLYIIFLLILTLVKSVKIRKIFLLSFILFFLLSRFIPFYFDHKLKVNYFGYDYSMHAASDKLEELAENNMKIYSNYNHYKVRYYAHDTRLMNEGCSSRIRAFSTIYPRQYYNFEYNENFIYALWMREMDYVLLVDTVAYRDRFEEIIEELDKSNIFKKEEEYYYKEKRQWVIYKFKTKKAIKYLQQQQN